jgi:hypothetical protein
MTGVPDALSVASRAAAASSGGLHGCAATADRADPKPSAQAPSTGLTDSLRGREAVAVGPRMVARAAFLASLGLRPAEHPAGVGEHIPADATGRTEVPGVWVAGNITDLTAQVGAAAASGAMAAAQINADLVAEGTRQAVAAYREPFSAESEAQIGELMPGDRRHGL